MKETRYFYAPDARADSELPQDEALHALKVLRLKEGDEIFLMDGRGTFYRAHISMTASRRCFFDIDETLPQEKHWRANIHLAIAPTKMMERMEWLVEKAVEVGVDEITFLFTKFTERKAMRHDRMEKIAIAAMKQSRKPFLTKINPLTNFSDFISAERNGRKYISHCYAEIPRTDFFCDIYNEAAENITILVGPEGDFSIDEVEAALARGFKSVTFGESRLRTETAGLVAITMANLALRK